MSTEEYNVKFCDKCKQEVNFGEYQGHKNLKTEYQKLFTDQSKIKIKYSNGYTVIDRGKESVVHTCKSCKRSKGNILGIKLDH